MEIRPITFLVGPNSSGKSSVLQAILALKQTVESGDQISALILQDYADLGSYRDVVFGHDTKNEIKINFEDSNSNKWSLTYSTQEGRKSIGQIFVKSLECYQKSLENTPFSKNKGSPAFTGEFKITRNPSHSWYEIRLEGQEVMLLKPFDLRKFYILDSKKLIGFSDEMSLLFHLFVSLRNSTEELFNHICHIGPLRKEPERVYTASGAHPRFVGKSGQWTIDILQYDKEVRNIIRIWLKKFNISLDFTLEELKKGSERYEVVLEDYFTHIVVNLADVGFGTSQTLPIIVQGFTSPENATLLIEQPEIHLHPRAQCTMGDLLVDIAKMNKRLIIETHSDILIERVCKHILYKDENEKIKPEDVIIYYFEPTEEGTVIRTITVNENAQFENFQEGFFEERFEEALERAELME